MLTLTARWTPLASVTAWTTLIAGVQSLDTYRRPSSYAWRLKLGRTFDTGLVEKWTGSLERTSENVTVAGKVTGHIQETFQDCLEAETRSLTFTLTLKMWLWQLAIGNVSIWPMMFSRVRRTPRPPDCRVHACLYFLGRCHLLRVRHLQNHTFGIIYWFDFFILYYPTI